MSETKPALTWREKLAKGYSSAKSAASSAASSASSGIRRGMAASSDKSSGEIKRNVNKCKLAAESICNDGKLPVAGGELFTTESKQIGDVEVTIYTATPLGVESGMVYDEQNYQAVRRALPSKGVRPSINDPSKMEQYEKDVVVLQPWSDKRKPIPPEEGIVTEAAAGGGMFDTIKGKFGLSSSSTETDTSTGGTRRVGRKSKRGRKSRKASKSRKSRKSSKSRKVRKARRGSKSRKSRRC
jgi:hypothetical protein